MTKTLEIKLREYLSKSLYSSQRIKDYFLPILLAKGQVTREELKKEFVKLKAAPDESQAGYFLSLNLINRNKWKDYLRQVIYYDFPNYKWVKDNFMIKKEYVDMVKKLLTNNYNF
jgi:hypothetical protein